jgi:hypothetical protein
MREARRLADPGRCTLCVSHSHTIPGPSTAGWPLRRRLCHGDARHTRVLWPAAHLAAAWVKADQAGCTPIRWSFILDERKVVAS